MDLLITSHRPNLSNSSLKVYLSALRKLNDGKPVQSITFLLDYNSIIEKLIPKSNNTKKSYLTAVGVALQAAQGKSNKYDEIIKKYDALRDSYQNEYVEQVASHEKTPKQAANWVDWLEWVDMADNLTDKTKHLRKKSEWSKDELLEFQDHVITQLYKHYPVRNDYHDTKIISKREYNTLKDNDKKSSNYVVLGRPMMLILNEYKTSKKYGEKKIKIDATVANSIRIFLKHNTSGFLLVSPTHIDRPINSNGITKTLQRISAEHFDGKKVGSSLIRHMYLSEKYGKNVLDKAEDSYIMGHSLAMQNDYVKI